MYVYDMYSWIYLTIYLTSRQAVVTFYQLNSCISDPIAEHTIT